MQDSRTRKMQETLKTADNHRQLWTADEDKHVLNRTKPMSFDILGWKDVFANDEELAVYLGRTITAVSQRRVVLNRLMESGMTLEEIHEAERWRRAERNNIRYDTITRLLAAQCPECFCSPHAPNCSRAD